MSSKQWSRGLGEGRARSPSAQRSIVCGVVIASLAGCSGSKPNFGTLPVVQVELPEDTNTNPGARPIPPKHDAKTEVLAIEGDAPDPPALRQKEQVDLDLAFERGEVRLVRMEEKLEKQEELTARRMGRFAVELFVGAELVERVRFDFPLLAESADVEKIEAGLTASARVRVPLAPAATRAWVLDRKTRRTFVFRGRRRARPARPPKRRVNRSLRRVSGRELPGNCRSGWEARDCTRNAVRELRAREHRRRQVLRELRHLVAATGRRTSVDRSTRRRTLSRHTRAR